LVFGQGRAVVQRRQLQTSIARHRHVLGPDVGEHLGLAI